MIIQMTMHSLVGPQSTLFHSGNLTAFLKYFKKVFHIFLGEITCPQISCLHKSMNVKIRFVFLQISYNSNISKHYWINYIRFPQYYRSYLTKVKFHHNALKTIWHYTNFINFIYFNIFLETSLEEQVNMPYFALEMNCYNLIIFKLFKAVNSFLVYIYLFFSLQ